MAGVEIKGLAELKTALGQLTVKLENNVLRGALRAAMKVIEKDAKQRVSVVSGELRDTIRSNARPDKRTGKLVGYVKAGPVEGTTGKKDAKGWYAGWVEFGTAAHLIKVRPPGKALAVGVAQVQHPGSQKKPFLRPAFDTKQGEALEVFREYIRKRLALKHGIDVPGPDSGADGAEG